MNLFFVDTRHGWIVGEDGLLLATSDGGATWERLPSGTQQDLLVVTAIDPSTVWVGGFDGGILASVTAGR